MWPTKFSFIAAALFCVGTANAQCLPSVGALDSAVNSATAKLAEITQQTADAQEDVDRRAKAVEKTIANVSTQKRSNQLRFDRASNALANAQREYEAASAQLQTLMVPRIEAERVLRGARQMRSEAGQSYRAQSEALSNAVERARRGEVTPSLTDALSCADGDCGRIDARTHAAMVTIGAVAETVDSGMWPTAGRECDFTLLEPAFARERTLLGLSLAQNEAFQAAQSTNSLVRLARQQYGAALQERDAAVNALKDLSDSEFENLKVLSAAVTSFETELRRAEATATAAQAREREAAEKRIQHLNYWGRLAMAVTTASYVDDQQPFSGSALDSAALTVMGANPTGKATTCLLKIAGGQEKAVTFAPIPPAKC